MIVYLTHENIDKTKWDLCIEQAQNSFVYAYSWYLDTLAPGWEALVLGDYEAVMPLTRNKKAMLAYLYQPFFAQQLGMFFKHSRDQDKLIDFMEAIPAHFRYIDINLNEKNELMHTDYVVHKRKNLVLDLNHPYAKLHKEFDDHCKRNLKKAKKFNQTIASIDADIAVSFYQKYKGNNTANVLPKHYKQFKAALQIALQRDMLLSRGVFNEHHELIATGIFLIHQGRIIYMMGGASAKGRDARSMYALFDHVIVQFCEHPMLFDFEGSEIPGIARFYKGFGAEKRPYFKLRLNRLPWFIRWLK
jgi:lipid II:glycine glycyltransferase (peptidoglycan interpeptide bridge formation enzyme)